MQSDMKRGLSLALSIKHPEAERLAGEVARRTGETMTQAVIVALQERLERLTGRRRGPDLAEALLRISERCRSLPHLDARSPDEVLGYGPDGSFEHGDR
jgi:antitoxin VapB